MTDISIIELEKKLKEDVERLTKQKSKAENEISDAKESARKIIAEAEIEARQIVEGAKSEASLFKHNLDKRASDIKDAEKLFDKMREDSDALGKKAESVRLSQKKLDEERATFELYKAKVIEKEDLARLMLEQANQIAADKGVKLEPPKKEEKKEKAKK